MEYLSARDCVVGGCNNIDSLCAMGDTSLSFGEVDLMALNKRRFDALIIGAGGAGLNAAVQFANTNARVAVVSKVFPTRSHTVAAQGGVNAALANVLPDNWHWHMFDTVKGSDYLGDQDSIEYMCREAIPTVYELEHNGVPFSRLDNGKIYQRAFGGQSQNFGGAQAARTCAAADRTGHAILHSLYQQNVRARTHFFDEYFAIDLIQDDEGAVLGALVMEIETGEPLLIEAKSTVLATGGCGQVYRTTSNAHINTGDGTGMVLRAGIPLMDMEFYQFHPTGIAGRGMLITEGVRGEGGYLVNKDGERFMERYAPNAKDLASRDVVSRAIVTEVKEGRGCGPNGDHVLLKLDHSGEEVVPGLYAAGEAACVSVHGANRLGGNSLLDILVFGRAAGLHVLDNMEEHHRPMNEDSVDQAMQSLQRLDRKGDGLSVRELRDEFRKTMEDHAGVFRTEEIMSEGVEKIKALRKKMDDVVLTDHSKVFNTARIEALELQNLMDCGIALAASALARKESRGAHSRPDYPDRNDAEWMKHSLYYLEGDRIDFKPVQTKPLTVDSFPPKERVY